MQRASAAFGLLVFGLWLAVLAIGLAYVTVWATTQRRPQWRILRFFRDREDDGGRGGAKAQGEVVSLFAIRDRHERAAEEPRPGRGANVIPFAQEQAQRRRRV